MKRLLAALFFLLPFSAFGAEADIYSLSCTSSTGNLIFCPVSVVNPLPISGSFSATIGLIATTSTNLSGTISVTSTFQSIQVSTAGRKGCAVQNNGTHTMYVFFGAIGSATTSNSVQLAGGQSVSCAVGGIAVLTDQVSITGTSGEVFFANFQ